MNEEEGKFIEKLKKIRQDTIKANECGLSNNDFKEEIEVYDMVLSLLDKLQKENKEKDKKIKKFLDIISKNFIEIIKDELVQQKNKEIILKDKQIDSMAEYIYNMQIECNVYYKDKKQVKQYFENKAKKDNINERN